MADDKRYYRTEIPNIIDDLGLDPHERALYVHYKRACGGDDCEWVESARITAQRTKMSHTRASQARAALVKRGLITVTGKGNDGTSVGIVDIWELNNAYYGYKDGRPDIDGWTIGQLKEWVTSVNNIYTLDQKRVSEPVGVNNMNTSVNNIYNKKEPLEESLPKGNGGKPPTPAKVEKDQLEPDTPETRLLFARLNQNRQAKNRSPAKRFKSLEQKEKCLKAAQRLGYQGFSDGLQKAFETGITEIDRLVNWIAKWGMTPQNGVYSDKPTTKPAVKDTPELRRRIAEIEAQDRSPPDA